MHAEAHSGDWQHHMCRSAQDWRMYPALSEKDWSVITLPMLLIGGENDIFASRQKLLRVKEYCPQAEIWVVAGGNHRPHMPMEQIKAVNIRMLDFLKQWKDA